MLFGERPVRNWRMPIALFAIVCSIAITTIALTPIHGHPERNCDICTFAHLPLLQAIQTVLVMAPDGTMWLNPGEPAQTVSEHASGSPDSRAPPAQS